LQPPHFYLGRSITFFKILGLARSPTEDGACLPSPLALKLATSPNPDFDGGEYAISARETKGRFLWSLKKR
jgi:hypothetical protein